MPTVPMAISPFSKSTCRRCRPSPAGGSAQLVVRVSSQGRAAPPRTDTRRCFFSLALREAHSARTPTRPLHLSLPTTRALVVHEKGSEKCRSMRNSSAAACSLRRSKALCPRTRRFFRRGSSRVKFLTRSLSRRYTSPAKKTYSHSTHSTQRLRGTARRFYFQRFLRGKRAANCLSQRLHLPACYPSPSISRRRRSGRHSGRNIYASRQTRRRTLETLRHFWALVPGERCPHRRLRKGHAEAEVQH